MRILALNGSPRIYGNTAAMVSAFAEGAQENGHQVDVVNVCRKKLPGVLPANTVTKKIPAMSGNVFSRTICRKFILCWMRRERIAAKAAVWALPS